MANWVSNGMDNRVSNNRLGTMKPVGRVSNCSNSSSKSLGLGGTPVFSLKWFGDRLWET